MKSHVYFNCSLLVAVFLVGYVLAEGANETNHRFLETVDCISTSGNKVYCEIFVNQCIYALPEMVKEYYRYCLDRLFPDGRGTCKNGEELYKSAEKRKQLDFCIRYNTRGQCTDYVAQKLGCAVPSSN
ncbi:unnamed protein product [Larinioides sclopetarius]|uniref:Uncharacterized protein n=1 Tax=Larinioides sclopetarius TaxID=280406 RepID=A0AAV1ZV53_9ARAC